MPVLRCGVRGAAQTGTGRTAVVAVFCPCSVAPRLLLVPGGAPRVRAVTLQVRAVDFVVRHGHCVGPAPLGAVPARPSRHFLGTRFATPPETRKWSLSAEGEGDGMRAAEPTEEGFWSGSGRES